MVLVKCTIAFFILPGQRKNSIGEMFSPGHGRFREPPSLEVDDDGRDVVVVDRVEDFAELVEVLDEARLVVELVAGNEELRRSPVDGSDAGA